ncbi:MAG: phospho-sugar mutase [Clostridia bacterium]|nr:phospho-sugar mutase [Clostridia bacterium]
MTDVYELWLDKVKESKISEELKAMEGDSALIHDSFYRTLDFGTSGLRGIMAAGTNRMNVYTVAAATEGVVRHLAKGKKSVVIGYDSRLNSKLFAQTAATVFANRGFEVYLAIEVTPTPYLSFLVRYLKTSVGIMVTASHNPKEYNGYKVYGSDGCQLNTNSCEAVQKEISKVNVFALNIDNYETNVANGRIKPVDNDCFDAYTEAVRAQSVCPIENIKITYSALNGAGFRAVPCVLTLEGCKYIELVEEQCYPDGNFTTCPSPNPERADARALLEKQAVANGSDIYIATDPDADRCVIGIVSDGKAITFNGHMAGALLTYFLASVKKERGESTEGLYVCKTIVTTNIIYKIAEEFGLKVVDLLTGFKYIGEFISALESKGEQSKYLLGFEESCGFLAGDYVKDKDAVVASMLFAQMCSYYKKSGKTLSDVLEEIYVRYGRLTHSLISERFDGETGFAKMQGILNGIRSNPPKRIGELEVLSYTDLLKPNKMRLPKSDVIIIKSENDACLIIRPSGTEPLLKFYLEAKNPSDFTSMKSFIDEIKG